MNGESAFKARAGRIIVSCYSGICFEIKFSGRHRRFDSVHLNLWLLTNTGSIVLVTAWTTDNRWPPAVCAGWSSMALFTRTAKLDPGAHGVRCTWAMAVHHAVGISHQRNSGYRRPNRVNIMAQGLSTPDPSLSPTHLSIRRGHATITHHQVSLMVSCNSQHYTDSFPGVVQWASLWGERKKERKKVCRSRWKVNVTRSDLIKLRYKICHRYNWWMGAAVRIEQNGQSCRVVSVTRSMSSCCSVCTLCH